MTKTEKTALISVEKLDLKHATKNINNWKSMDYLSGGVTAPIYSAKAEEDLDLVKELNKSTKLIPTSKLNKVIKSLKEESQEQAMYQDSSTLTTLASNITTLASNAKGLKL